MINILTISGSLRVKSLNTALLRETARVAPAGIELEHFDRMPEIPLFNEDEEHPAPPAVADLRARVAAADGLLIATPEYNASVPGVLKNTIDWLSRPSEQGLVLEHKPVAIIGASMGPFGTSRAQLTLRQVLHKVNSHVLGQPEFLLVQAHQQIGADGRLEDSSAEQALLVRVLHGLAGIVEERRIIDRSRLTSTHRA